MSPDPYQNSYNFSDPQSLNRYSYALNDPLSKTDPTGKDDCSDDFNGDNSDRGTGGCSDYSGDGGSKVPASYAQSGVNTSDKRVQRTPTSMGISMWGKLAYHRFKTVDNADIRGSFLSMRNVTVARGDTLALHGISLDIALGEHIVLLGPNGCGKSTLIKTLTRELYPMVPLAGEPPMRCTLLGRERWDLSQLRSEFGVVSAELPGERTPGASGLDAVLAGYFGASALWPNHVVTPAMRQGASEAMQQMRATHLAVKPVSAMSAGEQRRIMIARALVHQPRMLLLDEPSNALDLQAQLMLRLALRAVAQAGTGLVLVTHQWSDIIPEVERVVLMREGRIAADGPRRELLREEVLSELFAVPITLHERDGFLHAW